MTDTPPLEEAANRLRRRWHRATTIVATSVVAVIVLGAAIWVLYFSPFLAVKTIAVEGTQRLPENDVVNAVATELDGQPMMRVRESAVAAQVADLSAVQDAAIQVQWPSTVVIQVTERPCVGVVVTDEGARCVDANGEVFDITGVPAVGPRIIADAAVNDGELVRASAQVLASLPHSVADQVVDIDAESIDSVTLKMSGGRSVVWGNAEDSLQKADVLKALLAQGATHYDVSAPNLPVTRGGPQSQARTRTAPPAAAATTPGTSTTPSASAGNSRTPKGSATTSSTSARRRATESASPSATTRSTSRSTADATTTD